jgi:2-oxoacid:acceptor oxidoreductase delta subunit (pyruvate/2-ketoisovalerate family)
MAICFESEYESAWQDTSKDMITVKTGEWRSKRPQLIKEVCRQCGNCYVYCPLGCYDYGEDGYFHPDLDYCKGCGVCAYECPAHAIKMVTEEED